MSALLDCPERWLGALAMAAAQTVKDPSMLKWTLKPALEDFLKSQTVQPEVREMLRKEMKR